MGFLLLLLLRIVSRVLFAASETFLESPEAEAHVVTFVKFCCFVLVENQFDLSCVQKQTQGENEVELFRRNGYEGMGEGTN